MTDPAPPSPTPSHASRYGRAHVSAAPRRLTAIVLTALAIATGAGVAVLGYQRLGTSEVKGELGAYHLLDDDTVSVTISVTRSDPSRPVVCIVRVRTGDGSETGRREVLVGPATATTIQVTTIVKSSKPPVIGDIYGCGTDVPAYLRSP